MVDVLERHRRPAASADRSPRAITEVHGRARNLKRRSVERRSDGGDIGGQRQDHLVADERHLGGRLEQRGVALRQCWYRRRGDRVRRGCERRRGWRSSRADSRARGWRTAGDDQRADEEQGRSSTRQPPARARRPSSPMSRLHSPTDVGRFASRWYRQQPHQPAPTSLLTLERAVARSVVCWRSGRPAIRMGCSRIPSRSLVLT